MFFSALKVKRFQPNFSIFFTLFFTNSENATKSKFRQETLNILSALKFTGSHLAFYEWKVRFSLISPIFFFTRERSSLKPNPVENKIPWNWRWKFLYFSKPVKLTKDKIQNWKEYTSLWSLEKANFWKNIKNKTLFASSSSSTKHHFLSNLVISLSKFFLVCEKNFSWNIEVERSKLLCEHATFRCFETFCSK